MNKAPETREAPSAAAARKSVVALTLFLLATVCVLVDSLWIARIHQATPSASEKSDFSHITVQMGGVLHWPGVFTEVVWQYHQPPGQPAKLIDLDAESADEFSRLMRSHPEELFAVRFRRVETHRGNWAFTHEVKTQALLVRSMVASDQYAGESQRSDTAEWREVLAQGLDARSQIDVAAMVRRGDERVERVLWAGVVHNLLAGLTVFVAAVGCFYWIAFGYKRQRAFARLSRGVCPKCRYDISATPYDEMGIWRCSECGLGWRGWYKNSNANDGAAVAPLPAPGPTP